MQTWKQFRFALPLFAVFAALLLAVSSCQQPCHVPNPLVRFNVAQDTFGVTPSAVPNAQTVQIAAFDVFGASQGNFNVAPGQQQKMRFDSAVQRPIQLKFTYQSASGDVVAEDSIRIDDRVGQGVTLPDMDIVVGLLAPGNQLCPSMPTTVTPTITNEPDDLKKATFNWVDNERFEITLTSGNISKKFRIKTSIDTHDPDKGGTCTIYNSASYTCATLQAADTQPESDLSMLIPAISDDCSVRGLHDGATKTISITYPSNWSISVKK